MSTPDGRFTLVFNGEIYNYRELARQFLSGVPLRSTSDTEVLLHLLAKQGMAALKDLRGMFAFALWDDHQQALYVARDPFGKKPLYIHETPTAIFLASELKAIQAAVPLSIDRRAAAQYFLFEFVPSPRTIFSQTTQLLPGHYCRITTEHQQLTQWWQPNLKPKLQLPPVEALARCDELLAAAVKRRLVSDVPVGVLLSGGIDSTTIAWYMRQQLSGTIHSFSIGFRERSFNEAPYARQAARDIQTTHHELLFSLKEFRQAIRQVVPLMDTPLGDASLLPTAAVSFLAKKNVTVVLDGDGSDELLGGYGIFPAAQVAEKLRHVPPALQNALIRAVRLLPTHYHDFSLDFKIKSFLRGLPYPLPRRHQVWLGSFSEVEQAQLLKPEWQTTANQLFSPVDEIAHSLSDLSTTDAISLLLLHHYLPDDLLVKLDRSSMMASVEARTPFLDLDFAEFALQLPDAWRHNKKILRQVMAPRLNPAIVWRTKKGFGIPLGWWLKGPLYDWAAAVLSPDKLRSDGIFNPAYVTQLLGEHTRGRADHRKKLWTILAWQLWYDHWIAHRELVV